MDNKLKIENGVYEVTHNVTISWGYGGLTFLDQGSIFIVEDDNIYISYNSRYENGMKKKSNVKNIIFDTESVYTSEGGYIEKTDKDGFKKIAEIYEIDDRRVIGSYYFVYFSYFDTDIGKPLHSSGMYHIQKDYFDMEEMKNVISNEMGNEIMGICIISYKKIDKKTYILNKKQ